MAKLRRYRGATTSVPENVELKPEPEPEPEPEPALARARKILAGLGFSPAEVDRLNGRTDIIR